MRLITLAVIGLGAATSAQALWFPFNGRRSPSQLVTVTETIHVTDGCTNAVSSEPLVNVTQVKASTTPVVASPGISSTDVTSTVTTFMTHITTITLERDTTTLLTTITPTVKSSLVKSSLSTSNGQDEVPKTYTSVQVIVSTVIVQPLPTPVKTSESSMSSSAVATDLVSSEAVTTIRTTVTSTHFSTITPLNSTKSIVLSPTPPYGNGTSSVTRSFTAPYGNGTSTIHASTGYPIGSHPPFSPSASTLPSANASSTCTEEPSTHSNATSTAKATVPLVSAPPYPISALNSSALAFPTSSLPTGLSRAISGLPTFPRFLTRNTSAFPMIPVPTNYIGLTPTGSMTIMERSVGEPVTATINGHPVTWINSFSPTVPIVFTPTKASIPGVIVTESFEPITIIPSTWAIPSVLTSEMVSQALPKTKHVSSTWSIPSVLTSEMVSHAPSKSQIVSDGDINTSSYSVSAIWSSYLLSPTYSATSVTSMPDATVTATYETSHVPSPTNTFSSSSLSSDKGTVTVTVTLNSSATTLAGSSTFLTKTSPSPSASCGPNTTGSFVIGFDDLPHMSADNDTTSYAPLNNPYNHLYWSHGFSYAPLPKSPYQAYTPPHMGVFILDGSANLKADNDSSHAIPGLESNGMFGAGPRYENSAFWVDAYTAHIGCNSTETGCDIKVSGYKLNHYYNQSGVAVLHSYHHRSCPKESGCQMQQIGFGSHFRNLTGIKIEAFKANTEIPVAWFIDDIHLRWSNHSCEAAAVRNKDSSYGSVDS